MLGCVLEELWLPAFGPNAGRWDLAAQFLFHWHGCDGLNDLPLGLRSFHDLIYQAALTPLLPSRAKMGFLILNFHPNSIFIRWIIIPSNRTPQQIYLTSPSSFSIAKRPRPPTCSGSLAYLLILTFSWLFHMQSMEEKTCPFTFFLTTLQDHNTLARWSSHLLTFVFIILHSHWCSPVLPVFLEVPFAQLLKSVLAKTNPSESPWFEICTYLACPARTTRQQQLIINICDGNG